MAEATRIGVDLGGTKIEGIVMDAAGAIARRERIPTPRDDYDGTLAAIAGLVETLDEGRRLPLGICTPGAISPASGLLRNSNSVCLNDRPFREDLRRKLSREIAMANDADCFTLSEAFDGAAAGASSVFGVILGTGAGGGLVIHGKLVQGPNAIAGEWGHNSLPRPTAAELNVPPCYCGRVGCIETFVSGPGLAADHERVTGERKSAKEIDDDATLRRYEDRLARALSSVINIVDPETIVLGGGLSAIERLYENVPKLWGRYVFSDSVATKLVPPRYGDSSGVRGAAWLAGSA